MNKKITEGELIEKMKTGDNTVVSDLYSLYFPLVSRDIIRQGGQPEDAQDVFSDAIIAILQHATRENFFLTSSLSSYLIAICRRRWYDEVRRGRGRNKELLQSDFTESNLIEQENPLSILEKVENREFLINTLSHIGNKCKIILTYYSEGYSLAEIAEKMEGMSDPYMVKKELYRCRIRMREFLENQLNNQKKNNE